MRSAESDLERADRLDSEWLQLFLPGPGDGERRRRLGSWIRELRGAGAGRAVVPGAGRAVASGAGDREVAMAGGAEGAGRGDVGSTARGLLEDLAASERVRRLEHEVGRSLGVWLEPSAAVVWARPLTQERGAALRRASLGELFAELLGAVGRGVRCDVWRLRRIHARRGPRRALELFRWRFPKDLRAGLAADRQRELVLDELGLLLGLREVAAALELVESQRALLVGSVAGAWVSGLVRLAVGEFELAGEQLFAGRSLGTLLGLAWGELGSDDRRFDRCLRRAGRSASQVEAFELPGALTRERDSRWAARRLPRLGAAAIVILRVVAGGRLEWVGASEGHSVGCLVGPRECPPELRNALRDTRSLERASWLQRRSVRWHAGAPAESKARGSTGVGVSCLSDPRSIVVTPVVDSAGKVRALIRLEFEHHLLPSAKELAELSEAVRIGANLRGGFAPLVSEAAGVFGAAPIPVIPSTSSDPGRVPTTGLEDPMRACGHALWNKLGAKLGRRRVWFFDRGEDEPWLELGDDLSDWRRSRTGRRALIAARELEAPVRFEGNDVELALAGDAACGAAIPLMEEATDGQAIAGGFLVVESTRSDDLPAERIERWRRDLAGSGELVRRAAFRRSAILELGVDVCDRALWSKSLMWLRHAARGDRPIAIHGPAGIGKKLLARWLIELRDEGRSAAATSIEWVDLRQPQSQRRTVDPRGWLERARLGKLVVLVGATPELVARSGAVGLRLPALCERRRDVPGLVRLLVARSARALVREAPELTDGGLAVLWRQPWEGGVRQLGRICHSWVASGAGPLTAGRAQRLLVECGLRPVPRLPSSRPKSELIAEAVASTACRNGRPNKSRAARYLGWDPATLAKHLGGAEPRGSEL